MKRTKLTAEELIQLNELLHGEIEGLDSKFQTYLQEVTSKPMNKDLKLSELSQCWEDVKQKSNEVKNDMKQCTESFRNMNRAARRQVSNSYNAMVADCNVFYQKAVDAGNQCKEIVSDISKNVADNFNEKIDQVKDGIHKTMDQVKDGIHKTMDSISQTKENVKEGISNGIGKINNKIKSFKRNVTTTVKNAFNTVKLSVIDFSANRLAQLANSLDKVYDGMEAKINFCNEMIDKTKSINGKTLEAYEELQTQAADMHKLTSESLKHGQINLATNYGMVSLALDSKVKYSRDAIVVKNVKNSLFNLDNKIAKLTKKEKRIQTLSEKLTEVAEALKLKVAAYQK